MPNYFFVSEANAVPVAINAKHAHAPPFTTQTTGSMKISGSDYNWTFYPSANGQPYGSIRFTGKEIPPASTYYTDDFTIASTNKDELPAVAAAPGSGSGGGSGGGSSTGGPAGPYAALQQFLADHLTLYFNPALAYKNKDQKQTAATIKKGGWGSASDAGLAMFKAKIKERIPVSAVTEFTGNDPDISDQSLTQERDPEYFKFAWVATHPVGQSGFNAAAEIGLDTKITSGIFATADTPLRKLYDMLALSPAPFVVVTTPIPAGAQIITSASQITNTVKFPIAFPDGAILGIGIEPTDSAQVYKAGGKLNTDVHGPVAKAVLAGDSGVTMQLKLADSTTYAVTGTIKIGESVTFGNLTAGAVASPAAAVADAMSLSGESRLQMNTSLGVTVGGTQPGFTLENVYMTNSGASAMNSPQVILEKRTGGGGDVFELSVSTATDAVILIPIIMKQVLKETVNHWAETILATLEPATTTTTPAGIPHVALKQITWGYEEHYRRFGLPDVGNIRLVSYEPSDSGSYPKDVNVISVAEARADGRSAESKWDPIDYAIAMYIGSNSNLVGTRLYTSSQLNRVMNSFSDARFRNG